MKTLAELMRFRIFSGNQIQKIKQFMWEIMCTFEMVCKHYPKLPFRKINYYTESRAS